MFFRRANEPRTETKIRQRSRWKFCVPRIPDFSARNKSEMEQKVVRMLDESGLCPTNSTVKAIFMKNINLFFILMETSGDKSIQLLSMSAPLWKMVASRARPQILKVIDRIKKDEILTPYSDSVQDIGFDSVVPIASEIYVLLRKNFGYLCETCILSPVSHFGLSTSFVLETVIDGMTFTFRVFHKTVIPFVQVVYNENYGTLKAVLQGSPAVINSLSKIIQTLAKLTFRIVVTFLNSVKNLITITKLLIEKFSNDPEICHILNSLLSALVNMNSVLVLMVKQCLHFVDCINQRYGFTVRDNGKFMFSNILYITNEISPIIYATLCHICSLLKQLFATLYPTVSTCATKVQYFVQNINEEDWAAIMRGISEAEQITKKILKRIIPFIKIFYGTSYDSLNLLSPSAARSFKLICRSLVTIINNCSTLTLFSISLSKNTIICLVRIYESNPIFKETVIAVLDALVLICNEFQYLAREFQPHVIPALQIVSMSSQNAVREVVPVLRTAQVEVFSTSFSATQEVACKSYLAAKRVSPSILLALQTITPVLYQAAKEIAISFKSAWVIVYPVLLRSITEMSPVILQGTILILNDIKEAFTELMSALRNSLHAVVPCLVTILSNSPAVYQFIHEILSTLILAFHEVMCTTYCACKRVNEDLKVAISILQSDLQTATTVVLNETEHVRQVLLILVEAFLDKLFYLSVLGYLTLDASSFEFHFTTKALICYENSRTFIAWMCSIAFHTFMTNKTSNFNEICFKLHLNFQEQVKQVPSNLLNKPTCDVNQKNILATVSNYFRNLNKDSLDFLVKNSALLVLTSVSPLFLSSIFSMLFVGKVISDLSILKNIASYHNKGLTPFVCSTTFQCWVFFCNFNSTYWAVLRILSPKLWFLVKDSTRESWEVFCGIAPQIWDYLEVTCPILWEHANVFVPEVWSLYKITAYNIWSLTCTVLPYVWQASLYLAPRCWSFNRYCTQEGWKLSQLTCFKMWITACAISSKFCFWANTEGPETWRTLCAKNRMLWNGICDTSYAFWCATTQGIALSWEIFRELVSLSWRCSVMLSSTSFHACRVIVCGVDATASEFCVYLEYITGCFASLSVNCTTISRPLLFDFEFLLQASCESLWRSSDRHYINAVESKTTSKLILSIMSMVKASGYSVNCLNWPQILRYFLRGSKKTIQQFNLQNKLQFQIRKSYSTLRSLTRHVYGTSRNICDFSLSNMKIMLPNVE